MSKSLLCLLAALLVSCTFARAEDALRVYLRTGEKTHGPGQHDHPRFLQEWTKLLSERGAKVSGGKAWPTAEQFENLDVVVVFAPDPWDVNAGDKAAIEKYAARGGGLVVLHDGLCGRKDPDWVRGLIGGAWRYGKAKWFEGDLSFYYVANENPIVAGASNFEVNDEMYYELEMAPEAKVLAATWTPDAREKRNGRAFPSIYEVAPQMWTFEKDGRRAFVDLLGHNYTTLELPQVRAVLLRGIAWAGRRANLDEFCMPAELASLRYPPGGPSRPADELARLSVHPEFRASLVAAEPLITKPIAVDWDAAGQMWVAETPEYPNGRRGLRPDFAGGAEWKDHGGVVAQAGAQVRPANDRISVLLDTDGDGVADKKTIFYEGLELVTGFVFYKDGVIVSAAPDILWLRDTDGDGKADTATKLYTGLGTRDTHAVINNLRRGLDGWVYATHGYSSSDHVTSGDGQKDFGKIGSGLIRFRPDGSAIEQYSSKGGNTWGLAVTGENDLIWTQPTSGDLVMETLVPESVLARGRVANTTSFKVITRSPKSYPLMTWEQVAYRQIDFVGSFTAAAGCAIYDGGAWPARFNGTYFTTEPTINIVHHEFFDPEGASYAGRREPGREETEFMRSRDMWFRPIEVRVGPDGALYVLDFYNQAVIHNDTRGPVHNNVNAAVRPDRDHYFGRIWRLDHRNASHTPVPNLAKAAPAELVEALASPSRPVRFTAQRLLTDGAVPAEALPDVVKSLETVAGDSRRPEPMRVQALWTLHALQRLGDPVLLAAIRDEHQPVSRAALKIVADGGKWSADVAEAVSGVVDADDEPQLQLAALLAAGAVENSAALAKAQVTAVAALTDPWLQSAALAAASRAPANYITAALALPAESASPWLETYLRQLAQGMARTAEGARKLVSAVAYQQPEVPAALGVAVLRGVAEGNEGPAAPEWDAELQKAIVTLFGRAELQAAAVPLELAWDKEHVLQPEVIRLTAVLQEQLGEEARPLEDRVRLVGTLTAARNLTPTILPALGAVLGSPAPVELQKAILRQLGETADANVGDLLVAAYARLQPMEQSEALAQILKRADWTRKFVEGLKAGTVPLEGLGPLAIDKLRHHPDAGIARLAGQTLDELRGPVTQKKDQLIASLLPVVGAGGDPAKGRQLFLGTCAVCHQFNGEGARLAPDLTGMGAHPRAELLVNIVDPNREVDPSFVAFDFKTRKGESFQGIIARENAKTVLVRDAAGEHELQKGEITGRRELGRSLMPEGFEAMGAEALRDIIAYLQSGDSRFRIVDLRGACTADSRQGIFKDAQAKTETLKFRHFGDVRVNGVPFVILDPAVTASGKNLVVLKGGQGMAKAYPQKVEVPMNRMEADVLEILGGVGGWAFPCCGDEKGAGLPAAKITVVYEDGQKEDLVFKNGEEFADYIRPHDVPGSTSAAELVAGQQVRVIRRPLTRSGPIAKLVLESYDNRVAPVFVAITAEKSDNRAGTAAAGPRAER